MKLAVEEKKLADRDLVKVVADRLAAKIKTATGLEPTSDIIALQGLQAASQKTGDDSYSKFVTEVANAWPAGNEPDIARIILGVPKRGKVRRPAVHGSHSGRVQARQPHSRRVRGGGEGGQPSVQGRIRAGGLRLEERLHARTGLLCDRGRRGLPEGRGAEQRVHIRIGLSAGQ